MKCKEDGDFIVRYSDRRNTYVLTVHWNGSGRHFVIQEIADVRILRKSYNYCIHIAVLSL